MEFAKSKNGWNGDGCLTRHKSKCLLTNERRVGDVFSFGSGGFLLAPADPGSGGDSPAWAASEAGQRPLLADFPMGALEKVGKEGSCPERFPWAGRTLPARAPGPSRGLHTALRKTFSSQPSRPGDDS